MKTTYPAQTCLKCNGKYLACPACGASHKQQTQADAGELCKCGRGVVEWRTSGACCQRHHHHLGSTCPHCGLVG